LTLAIATQDPNAVAETYVRAHMRDIAPGRTVAIALNGSAPPFEIPFLNLSRKQRSLVGSKAASLSSFAKTGYAGAISETQERQLDRFVLSHGVDRIYAEFGPTGCALRHYCKTRDLPLFVNFHGYDGTVMPRSRLVRHAYRLLAEDVVGIVCGSEHFKSILVRLGFDPGQISVIPCGIDIEAFTVSENRDPDCVIAVGRLTEKKAPHLMLKAFAVASRRHPRLRLEVIGDGPMRRVCEQIVAQEGLAERVKFFGARKHDFVRERMSEAGLFIQHSITAPNGDQESQGISLIEAMASHLPVVVTDHNGFRETVIDGDTGFLTPEGDVERMARRLIELAGDRSLKSRMAAAARRRVEERFSVSMTTARLRTLLGLQGPQGPDMGGSEQSAAQRATAEGRT